MEIIKDPIRIDELAKLAQANSSSLVKAVVDVSQEVMAIGGEMHADEELLLVEQVDSKRADLWGINIYPQNAPEERIEFDSMINLKPDLGNRSRDVEDEKIKERIMQVVAKLVIN